MLVSFLLYTAMMHWCITYHTDLRCIWWLILKSCLCQILIL